MEESEYDTLEVGVISNDQATTGALVAMETRINQLENQNEKLMNMLEEYVPKIVIQNLINSL
jgi:hypothetical protein